jgi:hypothetical protein
VFTISTTELINSFLVCYFVRALGVQFSFISIPIFMTLRNVLGFNILQRGKLGVVCLHGVFTIRGLVSLLRAMGRNMSNCVTYIAGPSFPLVWTRTTGALHRIVALWQLRSRGRPLVISEKGRVFLLDPCYQWNRTILAVVNVSSDGSASLKLLSNFFTRSNIAYACLLNCSYSILQDLRKSFDPERKGGV